MYSENPNYQPPKVWVSPYPSVNGNGKLVSAVMKKMAKFQQNQKISSQERLLILNVETEPMFSVYPMVVFVSEEMSPREMTFHLASLTSEVNLQKLVQ